MQVTANIKVTFGFETSIIDFGKVQKDNTVRKTANFITQGPKGIGITELKSNSEFITARVVTSESGVKSEDKISIEICLLPGLPEKRFGAQITAISSDESLPISTLAVTGTIIGDIEVSPEILKFSSVGGEGERFEPSFIKVSIINHSETRKLKIREILDQQNKMDISLRTAEEGEEYELTFTPKDIQIAGKYVRGNVVVSTDLPDKRQINIPYTIAIDR